jgi:hypothetical protein
MERRPESDDRPSPSGFDPDADGPDLTLEPRDADQAGLEGDTVQGWQEDEPTDPELVEDDGYHPEQGGEKYVEPDPVDEPLLAREEGLTPDDEEELNTESRMS